MYINFNLHIRYIVIIYIYTVYIYFQLPIKSLHLEKMGTPLLLLLYPGNIGMPASLKTLEMEVTTLNLRKKNGCRFGKSCGSGGNG